MILLAACTDYNLEQKEEVETTAGTTDSGMVDTASSTTPTDTDTDGTTITVTETGVATEPVYVNTGSTLYAYDPTTNTATKIGDFSEGGTRVTDMTDVAIDLSGHMYGCAYDELYAIDAGNARVSHVATMDASFNALTFLSDGRLIGAADANVYYVDTTDGRTSNLVRNTGFTSSGDIVGLPDGLLYWSVDGGTDQLVVVDPSSATADRLGDTGVSNLFGMGYAYGALLGFSSTGVVATLDTTDGRATAQEPLTGAWWGATTNPVLW